MCVVRRMFGAQVCSVVRWLFWCGLVGLLVVLIVCYTEKATEARHRKCTQVPNARSTDCAVVFVVLGDAGPLNFTSITDVRVVGGFGALLHIVGS